MDTDTHAQPRSPNPQIRTTDDQNDKAPDQHFAFSQELLQTVTKAYLPIVEKCVP